jgi:fumarylpyruvate hydrolase
MSYFFEPAPLPAVPVVGSSQTFPVHRIYCVGRNYADHAVEMGNSGREPPFFFSKPADAVLAVPQGKTGELPYPPRTSDLHYEVELVVAVGRGGRNIPVKDVYRHIFGYAVGLDMTRRDLQTTAKKEGKPWDVSKGFDYSAPIAPLRQISQTGQMLAGKISLQVNGESRQSGDIASMIWAVAEVIAELSTLYELQPGDLIYTGTPAGVGAVEHGDIMSAQIDKLGELKLKVV